MIASGEIWINWHKRYDHSFYFVHSHIREHFADQCYYFNLPVRREHAEYAAEALFDYLLRQFRAA